MARLVPLISSGHPSTLRGNCEIFEWIIKQVARMPGLTQTNVHNRSNSGGKQCVVQIWWGAVLIVLGDNGGEAVVGSSDGEQW